MLTAIDHVIIACADPDAAAADLEQQLGLRATGGGRHAAHGTFNRLIFLGDSYIELMGIFDARLAAESWWGHHIAALIDHQPAALAGVPIASDDLVTDVARLRAMGSPISDPLAGERLRPDGDVVRWSIGRLPQPDPDLGLAFLIEHDSTAAEWRPAERAARASEIHPVGTPARLLRVGLPVSDAGRSSLRLLRELGLQFRPSLAGAGARDATLGRQTLRLVPPGAGVLPLLVIRAGASRREVELLGVSWQLLPA